MKIEMAAAAAAVCGRRTAGGGPEVNVEPLLLNATQAAALCRQLAERPKSDLERVVMQYAAGCPNWTTASEGVLRRAQELVEGNGDAIAKLARELFLTGRYVERRDGRASKC